MTRFLHRHILLPAFETGIKRRKTFAYWRALEQTQWLAPAALQQLQFTALQSLIAHAFNSCPYYKAAWQLHGLAPTSLKSPSDFAAWPIVDRNTVRQNRLAMRAANSPSRLIAKSTGGSTGEPLHFDIDAQSSDRRTAAWHRGYAWAGAAPGTRQFYFWGADLRDRSRRKQWKDRLYNRLYRKRLFSCFDLTEQRIPELVKELNRYKPDAIVAYTKPLYELSRRLSERGIKPFSPKSIVVGAEKLYDFERELIEHVFSAPVFETYGSREFMLIGAECDRHEGMHLTMEHLLAEVLADNNQPARPGEVGNVVVTDLYNYGMPFIRYATGDRAVAGWTACSCGRGLPLINQIVGRQLDVLFTPDGRLIPGEFFPHLLKDFAAIRRFQVIQEQPSLIRLSFVADAAFTNEQQAALKETVQNQLGQSVRFELEQVKSIPLTASGKLQVVINKTQYRQAG
jgi:phenylacetate-CoA ligase